MHQTINDQTNPSTGYSLLKANDVAKYLNVSKSYVYMLMQSGAIPTVRLGKSVRVRPKDLEIFIQSNVSPVGDDK